MRKEKGQDIIEYALMLAVVVGIGFGIYSYGGQGIVNSISSVFNNAGSLLDSASVPAASSPEDIIKRLGDGRYQGLADILKETPDKGKVTDISWDSAAGRELARKLNIQMKDGDGWYARIYSDRRLVVSYYSADLNKMTISQLQSDYKNHPDKYAVDSTGHYKTPVNIYEVIYSGVGAGTFYYGTNGNGEGVPGHIEPSPDSNEDHVEKSPDGSRGMTIYPGKKPIKT